MLCHDCFIKVFFILGFRVLIVCGILDSRFFWFNYEIVSCSLFYKDCIKFHFHFDSTFLLFHFMFRIAITVLWYRCFVSLIFILVYVFQVSWVFFCSELILILFFIFRITFTVLWFLDYSAIYSAYDWLLPLPLYPHFVTNEIWRRVPSIVLTTYLIFELYPHFSILLWDMIVDIYYKAGIPCVRRHRWNSI